MSASKFNLSNPAVKRILQEVKEMQSNPSDDYMSLPLEDNIFEWQFAIRGPRDSEFEGGIYHGRIQLPPEYPFKPPAFMLLSPNGRFETQTKICLSISQYHPEHWQPSWSVRTALVALIAFMPTKGNGAIGSLDFTKEHRKALALKSVEAPPKYGSAERQKLIDEIHLEMIKRTRAVHEPIKSDKDSSPEISEGESSKIVESNEGVSSKIVESEDTVEPILTNTCLNTNEGVPIDASSDEGNASALSTTGSVVSSSAEAQTALVEPRRPIVEPSQVRASTRPQASDDHFLTLLAIGLVVALAALMIRKFYHSFSWINFK